MVDCLADSTVTTWPLKELVQQKLEVTLRGALVPADLAQFVPRALAELSEMVDVHDLSALKRIQKHTVSSDELQSVPAGIVVAGRDRNSPSQTAGANGVLDNRGRQQSEIDDVAPAGLQAGEHSRVDHRGGSAGIVPNGNRRPFDEGPERAGEVHDQLRRERLPDDSANPRDPDL